MRSKAPLMMMEQMIMLLVFALAAALCLQAFVRSDSLSRGSEARDRAVIAAQNVAEAARSTGGDTGEALQSAAEALGFRYEQGLLWQDFDEDWNPSEEGVYRLTAQGVPSEVPGLSVLEITVESGEDAEALFRVETAWQEVGAHE